MLRGANTSAADRNALSSTLRARAFSIPVSLPCAQIWIGTLRLMLKLLWTENCNVRA